MLKFIQTYYARPNLAGGGILNAIVTDPHVNNSDHYNFRIDEQLGSRDNLFFRYVGSTWLTSCLLTFRNSCKLRAGLNFGVGWTHVFSSSLLLDNRIGRAQRPFLRNQSDTNGIAPMLALDCHPQGWQRVLRPQRGRRARSSSTRLANPNASNRCDAIRIALIAQKGPLRASNTIVQQQRRAEYVGPTTPKLRAGTEFARVPERSKGTTSTTLTRS